MRIQSYLSSNQIETTEGVTPRSAMFEITLPEASVILKAELLWWGASSRQLLVWALISSVAAHANEYDAKVREQLVPNVTKRVFMLRQGVDFSEGTGVQLKQLKLLPSPENSLFFLEFIGEEQK